MRFDNDSATTGGTGYGAGNAGPGTTTWQPPIGSVRPAGPAGAAVPYSEWWKRAVAEVIDLAIIGAIVGVLGIVLGILTAGRGQDPGAGLPILASLVTAAVVIVVPFVYYVLFEGSSRAATPGKMAMGIQVCDASTFGPIGYGRALVRRLVATALWWALVLPGVLDLLAPLWDRNRQTWHDKAARTVVVDAGR